ncbi:MAG: RDD family protein [Clostridia bacterium]|nr:RDD family protein [Deltaproteobacteria bacterium]
MAESNPYAAPTATLVDGTVTLNADATRGARLGAILIDGLISFAVLGPVMYVSGYWGRAMANAQAGKIFSLEQLAWMAAGLIFFFALQFVPLSQTGQTWGKRVVGIKIITLDGKKPAISDLIFKRYLPVQLVPNIPIVGVWLCVIDVLSIFTKNKRCVHDHIAGTKVVNV